jgi:hypothetical protein
MRTCPTASTLFDRWRRAVFTSPPSVLPDPRGDAPYHGREPIETVFCRKGRFCIPFDDASLHCPFKLAQEVEEIFGVRWRAAWLIAHKADLSVTVGVIIAPPVISRGAVDWHRLDNAAGCAQRSSTYSKRNRTATKRIIGCPLRITGGKFGADAKCTQSVSNVV